MIYTYLLFIIGLGLLILGANWLVDGATSVGVRAKISPLVIGLTIVALGTSLPELVINVFASINHNSGMAIGNIVGSNISNILLILGLTALVYPVNIDKISIKRDIPTAFFATILLLLFANNFFRGSEQTLSRVEGLIFLVCLGIYLFITIKTSQSSFEVDNSKKVFSSTKSIIYILLGCAGLFFGGNMVSDNATIIAKKMGASDEVFSLTIIAIATSMPELVTSIVAALKKNVDIVIGNIMGSNIINILFILGISAIINPIEYTLGMGPQTIILLVSNCLLLLFTFTGKGLRISRYEGAILILTYGVFLYYCIKG